jgi:hypothetical protein
MNMEEENQEFLRGFAETCGDKDPEGQLNGWVRQLSNDAFETMVRGGYESGKAEGKRFAEFFAKAFEVISHTSAPFAVPDPEKTVRILADTKRMSALAYILIDYNHYRIRNILDGQTLIIENCLGWTEAGKTIPAGTPIQVLPCSLIGETPLS